MPNGEEGDGGGEWSNGVLHGPHMDQYTGIKDKNAQEIYEGDRVTWQEPNTQGRELGEVKWVNDGFSIEYEVVPGQFRILYYAPDIEVIGDIHENPEQCPRRRAASDGATHPRQLKSAGT